MSPGKLGGHVPLKIAGAHRDWLVERTAADAFTLRGLVAELASRGLTVDYRTMWKFVHAHGLSFQKQPRWPASRTVPTWRANGSAGRRGR